LHSCTCFEHYYAHLQEDLIVSIQHLVPDFVTLETTKHILYEFYNLQQFTYIVTQITHLFPE